MPDFIKTLKYRDLTLEIDSNGTKFWYDFERKPHRTDGPAVEFSNGTKAWYFEGKRHRTDGPAIEFFNRYKVWYIEGKRHRTDGPAVEYSDGTKEWWIEGKQYSEEEFKEKIKELK